MKASEFREKLRELKVERLGTYYINGNPQEPCVELWAAVTPKTASSLLLEELENGEAEIYLPRMPKECQCVDAAKLVLKALEAGIPF